jgi:AAA ATPase domain
VVVSLRKFCAKQAVPNGDAVRAAGRVDRVTLRAMAHEFDFPAEARRPSVATQVDQLLTGLKRSGVPVQFVADQLHVSTKTLFRYRTGRRTVPEVVVRQLQLIAQAHGGEIAMPSDASGLVGRDADLHALLGFVNSENRVVRLVGEPGIGKSTLVRAAVDRVRQLGRIAVYSDGSGSATTPFGQLVTDISLALGSPQLPARSGLDAMSIRLALFEAVARKIRSAGSRVLLVVDDAHDLTDVAGRLLEYLLGCTDVVVVVVENPHRDRTAAWVMFRERFVLATGAATLTLGPLSAVDAVLVAKQLGADDVNAWIDMANGNPLTISLLAQARRISGDLTVSAVLAHEQLRMFDDHVVETVESAAVLGGRFRVATLQRLVGRPVLNALRSVQASFVKPVNDTAEEWMFVHADVHLDIYDRIETQRMQLLHRNAIRVCAPADLSSPSQLLRHAERARLDGPEFIQLVLEVANRQLAETSFRDAIATVESVLGGPAFSSSPFALQSDLFYTAACAAEEELSERFTYCIESRRAAMAADDIYRQARALARHLDTLDVGKDSSQLVTDARTVLDQLGDQHSDMRLRLLGRLAVVALWDATPNAHIHIAPMITAIRAFQCADDPTERFTAMDLEGLLLVGAADIERRRDIAERSCELSPNPNWLAALAAITDGDRRSFQRHLRPLATSPFPYDRAMFFQLSGLASLLNGDDSQAEVHAGDMLGVFPHDHNFLNMFWVMTFGIARARNNLADFVESTREIANDNPTFPAFVAAHIATLCAAGHRDEAVLKLRVAAEFAITAAQDFAYPATIAMLAESCSQLRLPDVARSLHGLLLPYSGQIIVAGIGSFAYGSADRFLAMLHAVLGEESQAERCFDFAERLERRASAPALLDATLQARTEYLLSHR